jgi:hypothetical protein
MAWVFDMDDRKNKHTIVSLATDGSVTASELLYIILYVHHKKGRGGLRRSTVLPSLVVFKLIQPRGMKWAWCEMIMTNRYTKGSCYCPGKGSESICVALALYNT